MIYHAFTFVLCARQEIESLAQKIVKACTIPDDKKSLRLLRRFWKAISLEVPKKLPQMVCDKIWSFLCANGAHNMFSLIHYPVATLQGGRNLNFRELLCLVRFGTQLCSIPLCTRSSY